MWGDRRRLVAALILSLLANLFLGGVIAGHLLTRRTIASESFTPPARVRGLPADQRARFARAMAAHHDALRASHQEVRRARAQVRSDIAAPALDRARLDADLATLRADTLRQQAATHAALSEALGQLSPAARAALVAGVGDHPGAR